MAVFRYISSIVSSDSEGEMDDWERYFADGGKRRGRTGRRRSLGLAIVVASALVTLVLIVWGVTAEVTSLPPG
jgi:hypothetical protein